VIVAHMVSDIKTAVVLGSSGTIGSLTGGLLAQSGIKVYFLARTVDGAQRGLHRAVSQARAEVITRNIACGDYDHDMERAMEEADWVVEALTEDKDVKCAMYERLERCLRPDMIVSSTTSSLPLSMLARGRSQAFRRRFLSTHFYNPPGRMLACETTGQEETDPEVVAFMNAFLATRLGREVIPVKNVAAFAGNRIAFLLFSRITTLAEEYGVELMDYLLGPYTGRAMAPLATLDLVGLDIHRAIIRSLSENTRDEMREHLVLPGYIDRMISLGLLGNKTKQGFYRKLESGKYAFWDPQTATHVAAVDPHFVSVEEAKHLIRMGMYRKAFEAMRHARGREAQMVIDILCTYVGYAYHRIGEVTDSRLGIDPIDRVMTFGFHWAAPSVILAMLGKEFVIDRLQQISVDVPQALREDGSPDRSLLGTGKYFIAR
jgi:3-hydroxyacyl-CoA dehydrogenase